MEVWLTKVVALVSMLCVTLISGLSPIALMVWLNKTVGMSARLTSVLNALNCFAGGVFLATSMLHLLPDVRMEVDQVADALGRPKDLPCAETVVCLGLFMVMFFEHWLMHCKKRASFEENIELDIDVESSVMDRSDTSALLKNDVKDLTISRNHSSYGSMDKNILYTDTKTDNLPVGVITKDEPEWHMHNSLQLPDIDIRPTKTKTTSTTTPTKIEQKPPTETGQSNINKSDSGDVHALRSLVFLLALSTHTIFEGLALGLQSTTTAVWSLFSAIILHKVIMTLTVGFRFAETLSSTSKAVIFVCIFASMAPIGGIVGLVITEVSQQSLVRDIVSATLQGLATGTFLYVTFFEVLMEQMVEGHSLLKVLFIFLGFFAIAALNFTVKD